MNTTWTNGYQTEVNYTYGYYRDLSPNYQRFCLLLNGVDCAPPSETHTHCELGFGQGVSINVHSASTEGIYWGTDFNPAHAAHANQLAGLVENEHHFFDDSFEELLNRSDLPQFDSISLHGIWSWISYENQLIILKFIRHYLKPSGIVYISYNCVTGWAASMPIRELFYSYFKFNSKSHNPVQKVNDALNFSEQLLQQNPLFAQQNPQALARVRDLKEKNPNYLIHEYLNQDWQCFSFQQIVRLFEDIKLSFAGSTDLMGHLDKIHFTDEQQHFLNSIDHPVFKEQCRDYFTSNQFRRDLFIRGNNLLTPLQMKERLREVPFVMLKSAKSIPKTIVGILGSFNLIEEIYDAIGKQFDTAKYRPLTIRELETALPELDYAQILNSLIVLCHLGYAQPCQNLETAKSLYHKSQVMNLHLINQAKFHSNYAVLISPLTGIGVPVSHFEQLFYLAYFVEGHHEATDIAAFMQQVLDELTWWVCDEKGEQISDRQLSLKAISKTVTTFLNNETIQIAQQLKFFAE
ncbi:putative methyltransferase family protein [Acinetobacter calcoaceticus]|uniref:Putative methyltransferase family protein n=1 Tax=Acinetobacter calcoaceticus TaxID=471 RepID=A0A4R1XZD9_ACICA|nr:putative methyltransferase family protein [Acinetobacter calcoaceticus]